MLDLVRIELAATGALVSGRCCNCRTLNIEAQNVVSKVVADELEIRVSNLWDTLTIIPTSYAARVNPLNQDSRSTKSIQSASFS